MWLILVCLFVVAHFEFVPKWYHRQPSKTNETGLVDCYEGYANKDYVLTAGWTACITFIGRYGREYRGYRRWDLDFTNTEEICGKNEEGRHICYCNWSHCNHYLAKKWREEGSPRLSVWPVGSSAFQYELIRSRPKPATTTTNTTTTTITTTPAPSTTTTTTTEQPTDPPTDPPTQPPTTTMNDIVAESVSEDLESASSWNPFTSIYEFGKNLASAFKRGYERSIVQTLKTAEIEESCPFLCFIGLQEPRNITRFDHFKTPDGRWKYDVENN